MGKESYIIKENSWLARMAAWKLKSSSMAMVWGKKILLFNTTKETFLQNDKWVKHELCHVEQFKKHGLVLFPLKYIWESILKGYYNNKYEVEAREAENL